MQRYCYLFFLFLCLPFAVTAQYRGAEPMPKFRWEYPIPQLSGQKVKVATVVDYDLWKQDSMMQSDGKTLILREESAEKAEFEYNTMGQLVHAWRIKSDRVVEEADWETTWTYDKYGNTIKVLGHYTAYKDDRHFGIDSTMYKYDPIGRVVDQLFVEEPTILFPNDTLENRWQWRFVYSRDAKKAKREYCIIKKLAPEDKSCSTAILNFDSEGRLLEIRALDENGKKDELELKCKYDSQGRLLIKEIHEYKSIKESHLYSYNDQGWLVMDECNNPGVRSRDCFKEVYSYRSDGLLEWLVRYQAYTNAEVKRYKILYEFY